MDFIRYRPMFLLFQWLGGASGIDSRDVLISFFGAAVVIFILLPIHECAHGFAAKLLGDDTAERKGRLTLNPLAHIDPLGAIMLLVAPVGWAKPVPVNPVRATRKITMRGFMAVTAAAGPLSNLIFAYIFMALHKIIIYNLPYSESVVYLSLAMYIIMGINVYIALFNLLPVPPLDGSHILFYGFLSPRVTDMVYRYYNVIRIVFFVLIFMPNSPIRILLDFLAGHVINGIDFLTGFIK